MRHHLSPLVAAFGLLTILMIGCSSPEKDWEKARSVNTIEAYNQFINKYPGDKHVSDAKLQISRLQIPGKWQSSTQSSMIEFSENGSFRATFPVKIPSGAALGEKMYGVRIDMGFKLIEYTPKHKLSAWLTSEDGTRLNVDGEFKIAPNGRKPWAKALIYTDDNGNVKILDEYENQKFSSFEAASSDSLKFYLNIDNQALRMNQLSLVINSIDLQLNWLGVLTAEGVYRLKGETSFDAYIPLDNGKSSLVIFDGNLAGDKLILANTSLSLAIDQYKKVEAISK